MTETADAGGSSRRARIMREISARTGINEPMIERLVAAFYARVRVDPLIGPIFAGKVADWDLHVEKLRAFWSSVVLMTGQYHGQPMQAHLPLLIDRWHFDRWLEIFEATAGDTCPPAAAAHFIERARYIADSLERGRTRQRDRE